MHPEPGMIATQNVKGRSQMTTKWLLAEDVPDVTKAICAPPAFFAETRTPKSTASLSLVIDSRRFVTAKVQELVEQGCISDAALLDWHQV
jgi:hypothetical protein